MAKPFSHQLIAVFFVRLLLNTARRFVYPFAPALSRELSVPLSSITTILAASQFSSLLGLFAGPVADRMGNLLVMRTGLAVLAAGMLVCGLVPEYWVVFAGLIIASLGKTIFDPAIQSFIGAHVPFEKRGRAIGLIETAWAGSTLIGIPALGLIVEHLGLRASFFSIAVLAGGAFFLIGWILPKDGRAAVDRPRKAGLLTEILALVRFRPAAGMLLFGFWISIANDSLFVVYGLWFEEAFQISLVALGFSTIAIGGAELLSELSTAIWSDRVGLKRMICICLVGVTVAYIILPFLALSLGAAMGGIFLVFFFFEIVMVTSFSLNSEILPGKRATMLAGYYGVSGIGRMTGVFLSGYLWHFGGIQAVAWSGALLTTLGLLSLLWGQSNWEPEKGDESNTLVDL